MEIGDTGNGDPIERFVAGAPLHRRPQKQPDCPDEDSLRLLVPGLVDPAEAQELLSHAAECDWCGSVLREAVRDMAHPPTDAEEDLIRKLADSGHRRKLAKVLAREARNERRVWWPAAACFATLVLVLPIGYVQWVRGRGHTQTLLAAAYTAHRQMDVRVPGAAYAPKNTVMSGESSSLNMPEPLLEAMPKIKRGIQAHPDDPQWLQLEGLAYLLEGNERAAIPELERARSLRPTDAAILTALGAAYFQQAEKSGDDSKYVAAYDVLSEGARLHPKDPVLAFNLALASEHIQALDVAREKWKAYLALDSAGSWAAEARANLDKLKKN